MAKGGNKLMAYEEVTSPILTDATGQDIVDKLEEIAENLQPPTNIDASDVSYDNTQSGMSATNVQDAVNELNQNLTNLQTIDKIAEVSMSTTTTTRTIPNISAYRTLFVYALYSNGSARGCMIIPMSLFVEGREMYSDARVGTAANYWNIKYVSATSISNWGENAGLNKMLIYGQK